MQVAPRISISPGADSNIGPAADDANDEGVSDLHIISTAEATSPGSNTQNLPSCSPDQSRITPSSGRVSKTKQKRNKPTLSCLECVERKTKCDRGRPCVACIRRQSTCEYTALANLIVSAGRRNGGSSGKARYIHTPGSKTNKSIGFPTTPTTTTTHTEASPDRGHQGANPPSPIQPAPGLSHATEPFPFSNLPFSQSSPSNVFGVGSQHPFSNYWTCQGGLPEVITVLPSKEQADILIAKYFETVDPVYPFIHRRTFYSDYELFWALSPDEKGGSDASLVALHYAMYALGTQFMPFPSYAERSQTAEFYCSAANQALRVYSYLNRTSMRAIQAMLLMAYFLMNDNHASDAYAWAGIHLRQSYAMRLHRDPDLVVPDASVLEKQQRRKLWQAVFLQDTLITVLLKMPPTATHSDVPVESLADENELGHDGLDVCPGTHSRVENLMSIHVIAPQLAEAPLPSPEPHHLVDPATMRGDIAYMRCTWHLAAMVQENLSSPCSLARPIAHSGPHRASLVAAFRRLHRAFPAHLTASEPAALRRQAALRPRAVRQTLFLTSCHHHCLMLLHASENPGAGVACDVPAALAAAHDALTAFFHLWDLFDVEAGVWWEFQHRAFEESLLIATLLARSPWSATQTEPIYLRAKAGVARMLEIMERYGGNMEMHATRKTALHEAFQRISDPGLMDCDVGS